MSTPIIVPCCREVALRFGSGDSDGSQPGIQTMLARFGQPPTGAANTRPRYAKSVCSLIRARGKVPALGLREWPFGPERALLGPKEPFGPEGPSFCD